MTYEDFFTVYNMILPPKGYYMNIEENDEVEEDEMIDEEITDEEINNEEITYPGVQSPFIENEPIKITSNDTQVSNNIQILKGPKSFEEAFLKAVAINPEVELYKDFLVKTAKRESNFNSHIQNTTGAPNYGYFLMGKEEIKRTTGLSVEEFRNNPVQLILGAVKLYKMNLKTIKALKIYELGKEKGYSNDALVAGAWMGGPGGVKKYLLGQGDPSDSHWYGGKGGSSVGKIMNNWKENELKRHL